MMKKTIALIMCFSMILLVTFGCAASTSEGDADSPSVTVPQPAQSASAASAATAQPTPSSVTAQPTQTADATLSEGMKDARVKELQTRLIQLKYLEAGQATSYYGTVTKSAVMSFQKQNGLKQDGIAGEATLALLYSDKAKMSIQQPQQSETDPEPTVEINQTTGLPLSGYVIGIDPGHQTHANTALEPVAPGSSVKKAKVSSGTQGRWTRVPEYKVNLAVGLLLKNLLEEQGATVVMTRTTNDVNLSNVQRAQIFNRAKTDYAIRLHCNGSTDASIHGAFMLVPAKNPYLNDCKRAAQLLIGAYCKATGAKNLGIKARSDQTGFNWSQRMIINIEMGHMTNKAEDSLLASSAYQKKMAKGLLNGILAYFK